jgi:hypothetical protein
MLSDSCHSGSVARDLDLQELTAKHGKARVLPADVQVATYRSHDAFYDRLQVANRSSDDQDIVASVVLISGCKDNQTSADGDERPVHGDAARCGMAATTGTVALPTPCGNMPYQARILRPLRLTGGNGRSRADRLRANRRSEPPGRQIGTGENHDPHHLCSTLGINDYKAAWAAEQLRQRRQAWQVLRLH